MEPLTVHDLCLFKGGSTSTIESSGLMGIITIVTNEHQDRFERGTVLLKDLVTNESIVCLVDRLIPQVCDDTFYIKTWNYIYDETSGVNYLEFKLDHVFRMATSPHSVLQESFLIDNSTFKISVKQNATFYTTNASLESANLSKGAIVNIAGTVESVSVLYLESGSEANFFIEISGDTETVSIMFSGNDLIKYHQYFRIGSIYTFQNIKLVTLVNGPEQRGLFSFLNKVSTCHIITKSQYENDLLIVKDIKPNNDNIPEYRLTISKIVNKKSVYTGSVTRVIDSIFGIYELDDTLILCLFHYLGYSPDKPYRIKTKIRITHFHVALIEPEDGETSHLLNTIWKTPRKTDTECRGYAIIACMKSRIEIISFPDDNCNPHMEFDNMEQVEIKHLIYMDILSRHSNFTQFIRQMEIYAALIVKFRNVVKLIPQQFMMAFATIRKYVFAAIGTKSSRGYGNLINDFFRHDKQCSAIGSRNRINSEGVISVIVESFPSLDKVKTRLESGFQEYRMKLAGGDSAFETNNVDVKSASYDQSHSYCILGMAEMKKDGRVYLVDGESSILLATSGKVRFGSIYMVRRGQLFQEDLSYMDMETGYKHELVSNYLACESNHLFLLCRPLNQISFQVTRELDGLAGVRGFSTTTNTQLLSSDHQYTVLQVLNSFPIQTCTDVKGVLYLESRILVKLYSLDNNNSIRNAKKGILVLSSRNKSLKFSEELQVGDWCVIHGLDKAGTSIEPANNNFYIHGDLHTLFPVIFNFKVNDKAVMLEPDVNPEGDDDTDPTRFVYEVSRFAIQSNIPHKDFMLKAPNFFFLKPITVRGVVISKRLLDGFDVTGYMHKHSKQLYQDLGIGTGKANRKIQIQLRQPDNLDTITIYIDLHRVHYPLGLVVGATVTFRNLIRKTKTGSDFGFTCMTEGTTIEVNTTIPAEGIEAIESEQIESRTLSSFNKELVYDLEMEDKVFRICCYVRSIISLSLKWECKDCGSVVRNGDCHRMCRNASRVLVASAFVQISDGSACANASIDGDRLVFRLLRLTPNQISALEDVVLSYGEITYGGWGKATITTLDDDNRDLQKKQKEAMHGYTLEDLCNKAKESNIWIYCKVKRPTRKRKRAVMDEHDEDKVTGEDDIEDLIERYGLRNVNLSDNGSIMKSWEMQKIRIKVVELDNADERLVGFEVLNKTLNRLLNQTQQGIVQDEPF